MLNRKQRLDAKTPRTGQGREKPGNSPGFCSKETLHQGVIFAEYELHGMDTTHANNHNVPTAIMPDLLLPLAQYFHLVIVIFCNVPRKFGKADMRKGGEGMGGFCHQGGVKMYVQLQWCTSFHCLSLWGSTFCCMTTRHVDCKTGDNIPIACLVKFEQLISVNSPNPDLTLPIHSGTCCTFVLCFGAIIPDFHVIMWFWVALCFGQLTA